MTSYTEAVRRLLLSLSASSNQHAALKHLQLSFYLTDPYMRSIGRDVENVMDLGNTAFLEFALWPDIRNPSQEQCIWFGERLMSFFRGCPAAFKWLSSLILNSITFSNSDFHELLNTCSKIQFLSLACCDSAINPFSVEDNVLIIDAPHSGLVALEIFSCAYDRVDLIRAPKLGRVVCFDWVGSNQPLSFGNVPRLDNITLCSAALEWQLPFTLSQCLSNTTTLSILDLNFLDQMIWIKPEDPKCLSPVFCNLRQVYLYNIFCECDLNWTMFVLEAAPLLNNLFLKLSRHPCERSRCEDSANKVNMLWDQASPHFKHHELSLLQITCFAVDEKLLTYIRLVM